MLGAAGDLGLDADRRQLVAEDAPRLLHVPLAVGAPLRHHVLDLGVLARMQGGEGEVLQLPAHRFDAQPMRQGRVDLERLLGLLELLLLAQVAEGPHVVQPVGQLDEDDAHVVGHGDDHLADVLGLLLLDGAEGHLRQLGDPVDQEGHLVAELLADLLDGQLGVLHHVVQQSRGESGAVQTKIGADVGGADRMVDVRLSAGPQLVLVLRGGHVERADDQIAVEPRIVLLHLGQKPLEQLLGRYEPRPRGPPEASSAGAEVAGWSLQVQTQSGALLIFGFRLGVGRDVACV